MSTNSTNLYVRLFHGRDDPSDQPSDWGFDGPLIGPVGISWTYGNFKLHDTEWLGFEHFPVWKDLLHYEGKFYGDLDIFVEGDRRINAIIDEQDDLPHDYARFERWVHSLDTPSAPPPAPVPLDKNGRVIELGMKVRLCRTQADYESVLVHEVEHRYGPDELWVGPHPLSFYRNADTNYHSVEIV